MEQQDFIKIKELYFGQGTEVRSRLSPVFSYVVENGIEWNAYVVPALSNKFMAACAHVTDARIASKVCGTSPERFRMFALKRKDGQWDLFSEFDHGPGGQPDRVRDVAKVAVGLDFGTVKSSFKKFEDKYGVRSLTSTLRKYKRAFMEP